MMSFAELSERFEALTLRERVLVAATIAAGIWGLWLVTLDAALAERVRIAEGGVKTLTAQLQEQSMATAARLKELPALRALEAEIADLDGQLHSRGAELEFVLGDFAEPHQVPDLLAELVRRHDGITITHLSNGAAEQIEVAGRETGLFRHPVRIEMTGGYADVVAYLSDLEELDQGLNWRTLRYEVDRYPYARVVLEVESLSRHEAWLGV